MVRTILSGGGYNSRQVSHRNEPKTEPKAKAANPAGVAQMGLSHQFKPEPMLQGKGYEPKAMGSTGIANARKGHAGPGPGGGSRTIYRSGSQSPTPPAHEMHKGREILGAYGPEISGPGRRR
jgi:hypothetical protein